MTTENLSNSTEIPDAEQRLLAGVEPRIMRITLALGVLGAIAFWLWRGAGWAVGFAIGAALSGLSFAWMKAAVHTLTDAAVASARNAPPPPGRRGGSAGAVIRFVLRYALIGLAGYVIFRSSAVSLAAFFAGLFVSVAATLGEIGYQIYLSFRSK